MSLIMRGGTWHLRRHVPARFAEVEPRREVWVSLKTDSRQVAARKATAVWEGLIGGWEAQLAGRSDDGAKRLEAAREIAARHGLTYRPTSDVADLPLDELLARVEVLRRRDGSVNADAAPGVLGTVERAAMAGLEHLEQVYERDLERPEGQEATFTRIQDLLGVAPDPLRPSLWKAVAKPLEALIENYDEVQRTLVETKDEVFLHD